MSATPHVLSPLHRSLERQLQLLAIPCQLAVIPRLDASDLMPCDLLIMNALLVPGPQFKAWFKNFKDRMMAQAGVWLPALIIADCSFGELSDFMDEVRRSNWYFDVVHSEHFSSLPLRIANLLRIHDHLHELQRYGRHLQDLEQRLKEVEQKLTP